MAKGEVKDSVTEFATIAFTLLGVLFGMMIMTFIFGQLGPTASGLEVNDTGYEQAVQVQNNSLNSIVTYTEQSDTQFITIAIAITLIILIAVFLLFWKIFVKTEGKGKSSSAGNFA
jgi:glucan phosphoethanolaminetransferase (alkaline phosphatase superfamily)